MRACFSANVAGTPSSCHWERSVPRGFAVVGTETRALCAKSSRNSRPGSPIILYDAPDTCAEVIGTSRGASARRPTARRISIALRCPSVPSSSRWRCALVRRIHGAPARIEWATRRASAGFAGYAMSFNRTSIGSESFASSRRSWYAACLSSRKWITPSSSRRASKSRSIGLDRHRIIQALASQHALVSRLGGSMDRDDHEGLSERLSEHVELCPAAQAVDHDAVSVDSRQRALRPDAEPVSLPLRLGHPAHRGVRDREAPALGFFPDHIAHPDD